ncbi:hypothetical protein niasHT_024379 [Heterodera trifolii]|uniref:Glucosylceramidase n=1 Tax=Heterodera trifolii TaxID=157864 RepID=A0ABD2JY78_9BILA
MYLSATTQRQFAATVLGPELKKSVASKNVKIMAHDDQRSNVYEQAETFYATPGGEQTIDGVAVHWYSPGDYDKLTKVHNLRPNKFIFASEACTGYETFEHKVLLGDWSRGRAYAHDILNDLRNWVVGWTDWNMCLDLEGGPNLARNFVDSPIIVNASAGEFYKQPMFYAMAHFSRFVPRDSSVIGSTIFVANGAVNKFGDKKVDKQPMVPNASTVASVDNSTQSTAVEHIAFQTPNGLHVLVLINSDRNAHNVTIFDQTDGRRWTVPLGGDAIVTAIWKPKNDGGKAARNAQ